MATAALSPLAPAQSLLHETAGTQAASSYGWALVSIDDIDGDGVRDLVTSAPFRSSPAFEIGEVFALSGATGALLWNRVGPVGGDGYGLDIAVVDDADQDGIEDLAVISNSFPLPPTFSSVEIQSAATGAVLSRISAPSVSNLFGSLVAVPDADGDGRRDLLVAVSRGAPSPGEVRLYSTGTGAELRRWAGQSPEENYGLTIALVDDLDGDGAEDYAFTASGRIVQGAPRAGAVELVSSSTGSVLRTLDGPPVDYAEFGVAITPFRDIDGDGVRELAIADSPSFFAADKTSAVSLVSPVTGAVLDRILGGEELGTRYAVTVFGDYDSDGVEDLLIGAPFSSTNALRAGAVRVVLGATGLDIRRFDGGAANTILGRTAVVTGDLDGDGVQDFAASGRGRNSAVGRVVAVSAPDAPLYTYCEDGPPANSTGDQGSIGSSGTTSLAANDLMLTAERLPLQSFGFFIVGDVPSVVAPPGGSPFLCIAGTVGRLIGPGQVVSSGALGAVAVDVDLLAIPTPAGPVAAQPGDTLYFQYWHRDLGSTSALSNALGAVVVP
ncbi:MAG: VCBS repeat-containing protein [Planctomycetota bacterium]